ncbi:BZ3500_MvSof-1268-A1-R1_Chr2-1g04175 [Microbotryum saponariae]|uniref:BZ3500_MvSof-1268-A1-R1_Chr2-1g04175 protein n=1 Tax=Microbotryum saponariae TaxID=289078 RepID=A0A2X0KCW3_9BASI|nr:BZ3500_MvSof-1268-A1-R1_Chr2-1g04175 [Microbotryum saponariae]SCZ91162.1 BZ3501_MvSof-1269-A2-R1_Chr2-1g03831 [Microbotryum saponariae]
MASLRTASTSALRHIVSSTSSSSSSSQLTCCSAATAAATAAAAAAAPSTVSIRRRNLHQRVPLPYQLEHGLEPFLSPTALRTIAVDWQQGVLTHLNELVRGTTVENQTVLQTVKQTAANPEQVLAFNYASEALNNSFFLSTLTPKPTPPSPSSSFSLSLASTPLRDMAGLISHFSAHVAGLHPSSGSYVWLVTDASGNLGVVGTYAGGTPLVHQRSQVGRIEGPRVLGEALPAPKTDGSSSSATSSTSSEPQSAWGTVPPSNKTRSNPNATSNLLSAGAYTASISQGQLGKTIHPLCCISTHEHCYLHDYGVWGREEYVKNWWGQVDWRKVEESYQGFKAEKNER